MATYPIRAWCADGITAGDVMLLPVFGMRGAHLNVVSSSGNVPRVAWRDAVLFSIPTTTAYTASYTAYSLEPEYSSTVADDYSFLTAATASSVISGQFVLSTFTASSLVRANGTTLSECVQGETYDLTYFGNSSMELLYLFNESGILIETEYVYTAPRSTLTMSGASVSAAYTGTCKNYRVVHNVITPTTASGSTFITWVGDDAHGFDGGWYYSRRRYLYRCDSSGNNQTLVKDWGTSSACVTAIFLSDSGTLFNVITYTTDLSQYYAASEVYRSTNSGSTWTKVLTLPYSNPSANFTSAWYGMPLTVGEPICQTAGGRLWFATYGLWGQASHYHSNVDCPTLYYSDDDGATWTALGDLNDHPEVLGGLTGPVRQIHSVGYNAYTGNLHIECGDNEPEYTLYGTGVDDWRMEYATRAYCSAPDKVGISWDDFVPVGRVAGSEWAMINGNSRSDALTNGDWIGGVEYADGAIIATADGSCTVRKQLSGRYRQYLNGHSPVAGYVSLHPLGDQYVIYPAEPDGGNAPSVMFGTIDGQTFPVVFEGMKGDKNGAARYGGIGYTKGRRHGLLPWKAANSQPAKTDIIDLAPFVGDTAPVIATSDPDSINLDWSASTSDAPFTIERRAV